ncbi:hypothetical protein [Xenorhabdus thuongxuanensis]|uniref:Uncharacterized protein n=1 Tax=Xenorhabdus thuongxuanensis TaxID=1873484 RepID=A0A1Q5U6R6_9GAMM|nr:hypothetical protein [Xenorhabdus thuongxuanensis]OKP08137.1 hypothetical protein Xentx_00836 [Xenorhabdus thuongxuanensis]
MSLTKIETDNLKRDIQVLTQNGTVSADKAIDALKVLELRRLNSNLEYIASIVENAPWNIKE